MLFPSWCTLTSAAFGWCASRASSYTRDHLYTFLLKVHDALRFQMLISLTSVGVQDRSASPDTHFGSVVLLWCWACCKLDSRRDSICSWQARKQSCETYSLRWIHVTNHYVRISCCIRVCLHTGSLPMTCDSRFVRFWEENEASRLFRQRPCTAATTLPAATIDGGLAIKLTSDKIGISLQNSTINFQSIHWHKKAVTLVCGLHLKMN